MKRIIVLILSLVLICSTSYADIDVKSMTDQELKSIISSCSSELRSRQTVPPDWVLLFEYKSVQIYQIDEAEIDRFGYLDVPVAICNDMDFPVLVSLHDAKCNGWEIYSDGCSASAKSKKKDKLTFKVSDAFVESIDTINSLSFSWWFINRDNTKDSYKEFVDEIRFW